MKPSQLCSGVFWVVTGNSKISEYKLLFFTIPCDMNGTATGGHTVPLNSKSGKSYNHKKLWDSEIKNSNTHKPYNKQQYNFYPRGRVEVANNQAIIFLNPNINISKVINDIKLKFGLTEQNISAVRILFDGSIHYKCFLDRELNKYYRN